MEVIDEVASALKMDRNVLARVSIKAFLERESLDALRQRYLRLGQSMV
jgi:predicted transcriptional regulator